MFEAGQRWRLNEKARITQNFGFSLEIELIRKYETSYFGTEIWSGNITFSEAKDTSHVLGASMFFCMPPNTWDPVSAVKKESMKTYCICTSSDLFIHGCKCGGFKAEMEAKK